ncbi:MAG TPA: TIGR01458 family HAD-type hydrolase [Bryobacteraceae bacterium]|nr:TIGR01458 family HAD-type hydrolase [Bryobacteraceae bacterium]HUI81100.1 TIGR01458 family HAD-type hydrolase [Bryobacteraceae bacterium]
MIRGILFDLDGVLYNDNRPIAGAVETVTWVRERQIPHLFVTNTTSRARSVLVEKLGSFGIPVSEAEIHTPAAVTAQWLRTQPLGEIALFLRPSTRSEFAGLPCLPDYAERGASYVVIGDLEDMWDYHTLNRAFRLLHHNPDAQLIALGMTRYWLAHDGLALDVAPFVAALEHATGRKPLVFGKPAAAFFQGAVERLGLPAGEILMIGDDITADVGGAQAAGLQGALVKTGKFRPADLEGDVRPYAVLDSVADLPRWWESASGTGA